MVIVTVSDGRTTTGVIAESLLSPDFLGRGRSPADLRHLARGDEPVEPRHPRNGPGLSQVLQNGPNDQSSACETNFEVSTTSVLVLLGSCQSRLQRKWGVARSCSFKT